MVRTRPMPEAPTESWFKEDWKHLRRHIQAFLITYLLLGVSGLIGLYVSVKVLESKYQTIEKRLERIENAMIKVQ